MSWALASPKNSSMPLVSTSTERSITSSNPSKINASKPTGLPIHIYPIILQLFAHMSARVLVGPELCSALASRFPPVSERRPESPGRRAAEIRTLAVLDRQTFQPGGQGRPENPPTGRRTRAFRPRGPPRHAAFREAQARGEELEKHNDFIQWLMDEHRAKGNEVTPDELAQNIFIIMVASMHGTPSFAYSVLLDLLDYPATLAEIREEIGRVRRDELGGAPVWSRHALGELRLLDSFMRETLRVHPFTEATMQRTVVVPYTFKDGLSIPAGLSVNVPSLQHSLDPDAFGPDADTFDPNRWAKRRQGFDTSKFQFASTSDDWLNWG